MMNENRNIFCDIEKQLNTKIPQTLRNILIVTGFDDIQLLKDITEKNIFEIEVFVKTKLHTCIKQEDYINYYGPLYCNSPENFQFVLGHKIILDKISQYCKQKLSKKFDKATMTEPLLDEKQDSRKEDSAAVTEVRGVDCTIKSKHNGKTTNTTDISLENKYILKTIKNWTNTKFESFDTAVFDNMKIFCTVAESTNSNVSMTCTINCFCGINIKISKMSRSSGGSSRWIYTNYYTHFNRRHSPSKQHLDLDLDRDFNHTMLEKRNVLQKIGIERFFSKQQ